MDSCACRRETRSISRTEDSLPKEGKLVLQKRAQGDRGHRGPQEQHVEKMTSGSLVWAADLPSHGRGNQSFCPAVNFINRGLGSVNRHRETLPEKKTRAAPIILRARRGYYRVLGMGKLPTQTACILKGKFFSRRAEEKNRGVGGACVLVA